MPTVAIGPGVCIHRTTPSHLSTLSRCRVSMGRLPKATLPVLAASCLSRNTGHWRVYRPPSISTACPYIDASFGRAHALTRKAAGWKTFHASKAHLTSRTVIDKPPLATGLCPGGLALVDPVVVRSLQQDVTADHPLARPVVGSVGGWSAIASPILWQQGGGGTWRAVALTGGKPRRCVPHQWGNSGSAWRSAAL